MFHVFYGGMIFLFIGNIFVFSEKRFIFALKMEFHENSFL